MRRLSHQLESCRPFISEEALNEHIRRVTPPGITHGAGHEIVFTHGDLNMRSILMKNGRISGIVDWENAGWFPGYWEYTKSHFTVKRHWRWLRLMGRVHEGCGYEEDLKIEKRLWDISPPL